MMRYIGWTCLVLAIFGMFGCKAVSRFEHVYSDMTRSWHHPQDHFKRKVAVIVRKSKSFTPPASMDADLAPLFSDAMYAALPNECEKVMMVSHNSLNIPEGTSTLEPGEIFPICKSARQIGCNTLVYCDLVSITPEKRKRHFPWLLNLFSTPEAKPSSYRIVAGIFAYSTLTGAWYYHDRVTYEYNPSQITVKKESETKGAGNTAKIRKAFETMADQAAEGLCPAICNQIWAGFGIAATSDSITIHSGANDGIETGTTLDVWSPGEAVKSVDGIEYWLPGHKTGKVKMVSVTADTATGKVVSGSIDGAGSILLYQGALP